jgi:CelD/BcsL family acetyltransferase involved in cellulose biosynthesis
MTDPDQVPPPTSLRLRRVGFDADAWEAAIAGHPDLEVYHGAAWLSFLAVSQGAEPVVAAVEADGRRVGWFAGAIVRRYGVRILGSPLRGWGTQCMGFLLDPGVSRRAAADALARFAFGDLGCMHVELVDRQLSADEMAGSGYAVEVGRTFTIDLSRSEEELLAGMHGKTRQYLRKAMRSGLQPEVASDPGFADDFYDQLVEVFGRQGLVPTYPKERVRQLAGALGQTGQLLMVRVRAPDGRCVASGIAIGRGRVAVNWGAAFYRADSSLHPNEVFWWTAIRHWRSQGATLYDMGGGGDYKAKYGGVEVPTYTFHRSRFRVLSLGRSAVRRLVRARQILAGRLSGRSVMQPGEDD